MKIRSEFVSNSSSSSFIVTSTNPYKNLNETDFEAELDSILSSMYDWNEQRQDINYYLPSSSIGKSQFDWEVQTYKDLGDKINFCALQCYYILKNYYERTAEDVENSEHWKYLEGALRILSRNQDISLKFNMDEIDNDFSYIDHQSCASEGANVEIIESEYSIIKFLTTDSYIQGDNDNH